MGFFDSPFKEERELLWRAAGRKWVLGSAEAEELARLKRRSNRAFQMIPAAFILMGLVIAASTLMERHYGSDKSIWIAVGGFGFSLVGVLFLVILVKADRAEIAKLLAPPPSGDFVEDRGARELDPGQKRRSDAIAFLVVALVVDALAAVLVGISIRIIAKGDINLVLFVLALFFASIGLFLSYSGVREVLALRNPRPVLRMKPATPRLGEEVEISWGIAGRTDRLRGLEITLQGREETSFTPTSDQSIDDPPSHARSVFATIDVFNQTPLERTQGSFTIAVPRDAMHSFEGDSSKVIWALCVKSDVDNSPNKIDEMAFTVGPRRR
jgi:hypothetical protein